MRLRVAGMFESGFYDIDMDWAFMSLPETQKAFGLDDVVNSIELKLDDIYQAPEVARPPSRSSDPGSPRHHLGGAERQTLNALRWSEW